MRRARFALIAGTAILAAQLAAVAALADEIDDDLAAIATVGPMGTGSPAARAARDRLATQDAEILPRLLVAMGTPNAVALNWYRTAYEQIAARELAKPQPSLPLTSLRETVLDPARPGKVRRLVLKLLDQAEPDFRRQVIPGLLDDPEFRKDAVALAIAAGDSAQAAGDSAAAKQYFHTAFDHAREATQLTQAADRLKAAGEEADVVRQMGFVVDWQVIGPFDAPEFTGFGLSFPPEQQVDLAAVYSGQNGAEISWKRRSTSDTLGQMNLIQAIGPAGGAVGYAYSEFDVADEQAAQVRCGADDNLTVWLNGEKVLAREQWLNGTRLDRFIAPIKLSAGRNRLLVKVCQGPQHKDPAVPNNWSLQLRICDETGAGVDFKSTLPPVQE